MLTPAPQVATIVELARLGLGQRLHRHRLDADTGSLDQRPPGVRREGLCLLEGKAHMNGLADLTAIGRRSLSNERHGVVGDRRQVGDHGLKRDAVADKRLERRCLQRRHSHLPDGQTSDSEECRQGRGTHEDVPPGDFTPATRPQRRDEDGQATPGRQQDRDHAWAHDEPKAQSTAVGPEQQGRRRDEPQHDHTVMESLIASNLASPMPGTFLMSSMVLKPPLASR